MTRIEEAKWRWKLLDKSTKDLHESAIALDGIPNMIELLNLVRDELWVRETMGFSDDPYSEGS